MVDRGMKSGVMRHPLSWRSGWLRGVMLLVLGLLGMRLWWGWYAGREFSRQVAAIRGRGEAVWVEDMKFAAVPDSENAFKVQMRAAGAIVAGVDSPRATAMTYADYPPFPRMWMTAADASEKAHGPVFALMREARGLEGVQIHSGWGSPAVNILLPYLNGLRHLANTVGDGALYKHVSGDDVEAIERLLDLLHLTRSLRKDPVMVSQLVAIGIEALACHSAQPIAPGLNAVEGSAVRGKVRELMARLLDERDAWGGFRKGIEGERVIRLDAARTQVEGAWLVRPLMDTAGLRVNRNIDAALEASRAGNKPGAEVALSGGPKDEGEALRWSFAGPRRAGDPRVPRYSRWMQPAAGELSRYFEIQFRGIAERRATAVSLAAQLYRADRGRWPGKLEELVPGYLPAVPTDPFHGDGRGLGYVVVKGGLPDGGDRPLVFFDAGPADPVGVPVEPAYCYYGGSTPARGAVRQYRDLARWKPATRRAPGGVSVPGGE